MLLQSTIEFEKIVKRDNKKKGLGSFPGAKSEDVTWDNPVELENYINEV
jgi:hypothetical protein